MSSFFSRPQAAARSHSTLLSLIERRSKGDQWLFEARGAAHQLAFEVAEEGLAAFQPVCLSIRDLFGHLLRHGLREGDEILPAIERLLAYVGKQLNGEDAAASGAPEEVSFAAPAAGTGTPLPGPASASTTQVRTLRLPGSVPGAGTTASAAPPSQLANQRIEGREAWRMVNETRLGEILVREGRIDGKTLDQALVLQQIGCKRLGDVLVGMGKLTLLELRAALDHQRELTLKLADGISLEGGLRLTGGDPS